MKVLGKLSLLLVMFGATMQPLPAEAMIHVRGGWWCAGYDTIWVDWPGGGGQLTLVWRNCGYVGGGGGGGYYDPEPQIPGPPDPEIFG